MRVLIKHLFGAMMKEYKKMIKALKKIGFVTVGNGNHHYVEKDGIKVLVTRNIRNSSVMIKEVQRQYRKMLNEKANIAS
jgi:predicted RNA binding protein YcfA (HicA-like mRNA interferase family)